MRWLKRIAALLLLLALLLGAAAAIYIYRATPTLDGRLRAAGLLAEVRIERDAADVTHVKAASPHDAWFAIGYVHAQERGWQLEFNRRLMRGQLSEVLGPATLDTDKLLRTLGIARAAERQWQALPAEAKDAMQAYSDGINAFYADPPQALGPEFQILGVRPGATGPAWTPQDSVGWSLMMALDLGGNWGSEFARLVAAPGLTPAQLDALFPPYPGDAPASKVDLAKLYTGLGVYRAAPPKTGQAVAPQRLAGRVGLGREVDDWAQNLGSPAGKGSNNWVVDGGRSASGKPLLANDPHLGLSAPAIWYFARLQAPAAGGQPALDAIGATLPGLPFVVLGRTREVAWSFTNTNPDVQDLYLEQLNAAGQYRLPDSGGQPAWADFATRAETIQVKGQPDANIVVRESRHGPVLSDVQKSHGELIDTRQYVLALRWAALDADNQTVLAGLRANRARSAAQMIEAFSAYHSPMQNLVVADTAGATGFKAVGKVPLRRPDNDLQGLAPAPGWDARYDWAGWLAESDKPQADAAAIGQKGWLATANQKVVAPGDRPFIGQDWTVPYRFDRIETLLAARPKHDIASMREIQADLHSGASARLLPFLRRAAEQSTHRLAAPARVALAGFDGTMAADAAAPLVFAAWADELTRALLLPKLGEARVGALYGKRHFRGLLEQALLRDDADWCGAGGCAAPSAAAFGRALERLEALYGAEPAGWRWGRAHEALSAHRPFGNVPLLARFFDVRVPTGGDTFTVNVGQYWGSDPKAPFLNRQAASLRALYDLAEPENSLFIYQTGQSGLAFSPRYRDMRERWAEVGYRPLRMDGPARHSLLLEP